MLNDHAKLMYAIENAGEIIGRKKLQKMIYIAKKLNFPFQEKFNFHFFGPYSEELTLRVEELINLDFINEVMEMKNGYTQYRYKLTESGREFLDVNKVSMDNFQQVFTKLNDENARFLELVSTVLYFDTLPKSEVKEKVFTLKSKQGYTDEEVDLAYNFIQSLTKTAMHD